MVKKALTPSAVAFATVLITCGSVQAMPITTGVAPPPTIQTSSPSNVQLANWNNRHYYNRHGWRRAYWRHGYYGRWRGPGWRRAYWYGGGPYYGAYYGAYGPRYGYWHDNYWNNDGAFILPGLILLGAGIGIGAAVF